MRRNTGAKYPGTRGTWEGRVKVIVGLREYGLKTLRSDMVKATREQKANVKRVMHGNHVGRVKCISPFGLKQQRQRIK